MIKQEKTEITIQSVSERNRTVDELFYVEVVIDSLYTGDSEAVKSKKATRKVTRTVIIELKKDAGDWKVLNW